MFQKQYAGSASSYHLTFPMSGYDGGDVAKTLTSFFNSNPKLMLEKINKFNSINQCIVFLDEKLSIKLLTELEEINKKENELCH